MRVVAIGVGQKRVDYPDTARIRGHDDGVSHSENVVDVTGVPNKSVDIERNTVIVGLVPFQRCHFLFERRCRVAVVCVMSDEEESGA
jgi:hypothetical protein